MRTKTVPPLARVVGHLSAHAVAGGLLPEIVVWSKAVTGPGGQCCILCLYPFGVGLLSWLFPWGAPGAAASLTIRAILAGPVEGSATAAALSSGFRLFLPIVVFVAEVAVAVVRVALESRAHHERNDGA